MLRLLGSFLFRWQSNFLRRFDCIKNIGHNFVNARVLWTISSTFELDVEPRQLYSTLAPEVFSLNIRSVINRVNDV